MSSTGHVLVVLGSGPGIGSATAIEFAATGSFSKIVMVSRKEARLRSESEAVREAATSNVEVISISCDLSDLSALKKALKEVESLGPLGGIFFNAARIHIVDPLTALVDELEEDFRTTNLALYVTAQWGIPLLLQSHFSKPTFFVTGTWLAEKPLPALLSLSAVKASQQNMVMSFHEAFGKDIHFGLIKVMGVVKPDAKGTNPTNIAQKTLELYKQERAEWELLAYVHDE
ncbi:hypothetical protein KC343_g4806 [Hortaea werneckii]|uniref:Ketoreductase (KR) domain-containing protein n=1 Tax=Hortaea werneckii TaxID=91943 RepID=A0A3M7H4M5_HORWE|nr:hypothetical protein KC338_g6005 [Hortaea werneckii]KAI7354496.1 hypothetical protein KC320_g3428 [Hortaea werneckii]KAI7570661.1 hypothetical protein KC317_g2271 [Hortaea werneckii]KAI7626008.1 hypothetical protein KC346_g1478 [Hortaea werneckii]KAI7630156.1 hypothetical protein KC343_g4806 [Hortaea werneckii]